MEIFKVKIKKDVTEKLRRAQALNPSRDLAETLDDIIELYLDRNDPERNKSVKPKAKKPKSDKLKS